MGHKKDIFSEMAQAEGERKVLEEVRRACRGGIQSREQRGNKDRTADEEAQAESIHSPPEAARQSYPQSRQGKNWPRSTRTSWLPF